MQLRGEVNLDLDGTVTIRNNLVVTTFGAIPDLTLSSFELAFRGGSTGVLTTVGNLCAKPPLVSSFVGQNGKTIEPQPEADPARLHAAAVDRLAALPQRQRRAERDDEGAERRQAAGERRDHAAEAPAAPAASKIAAKAGGKRAGGRALTRKGRTITVKLARRGARAVTVKVTGLGAGRALARRLAARRGRLSVRVATRQTNKAKASQSVRLKLQLSPHDA